MQNNDRKIVVVTTIAALGVLLFLKGKKKNYFTIDQFNSSDGATMPLSVKKNVNSLIKELNVIQKAIGKDKKLTVSSGYRSPQLNSKVPGAAKNSFHIKGLAVDLQSKYISPGELANQIEKLISQGKIKQGGLGRYSSWTHYDTRGTKARWNG